jgi:hypothetical protein
VGGGKHKGKDRETKKSGFEIYFLPPSFDKDTKN